MSIIRKKKEFQKIVKLLQEQKQLTDKMLTLTNDIQEIFSKYQLKPAKKILEVIPKFKSNEVLLEASQAEISRTNREPIKLQVVSEDGLTDFFDQVTFGGGGFFGYSFDTENSSYTIAYCDHSRLSEKYFK